MAKQPNPRDAGTIRAARDAIAAQIEKLRMTQRTLSDELREVEGPIPDRSGRIERGAGYTIKPAG